MSRGIPCPHRNPAGPAKPCRSPAVQGKCRCWMHGGATGSGTADIDPRPKMGAPFPFQADDPDLCIKLAADWLVSRKLRIVQRVAIPKIKSATGGAKSTIGIVTASLPRNWPLRHRWNSIAIFAISTPAESEQSGSQCGTEYDQPRSRFAIFHGR